MEVRKLWNATCLLRSVTLPIPEKLGVLIRKQTGLRQPLRDTEQVDLLVRARMSALGLASFAQYEEFLESGGSNSKAEVRMLTLGLTNGETHFFRDSGQFALLEKTLLPALIRERKAQKTLRVWSAACSTGEEAYSIAIVIYGLLQNSAEWRVDIFATDINEAALQSARYGLYSSWSFRVISAERKAAHFDQVSDQWRLKPELRRSVQFARLDLINDDFPSLTTGIHDMDLVLCRNAFIYFQPRTVGLVVEKMTRALRAGGYLLTAHGELHGQELRHVQPLCFPESIVYQRIQEPGARKPAPEERISLDVRLLDADEADTSARLLSPRAPEDASSRMAEFEHLARDCANQGRRQAAEDWCKRALAEDPTAANIYYLLAQLAEEEKETERAKELLRKVLYLDPEFVPAYIDLAALYLGENDSRRARKNRSAAIDCLQRRQQDPEGAIDAATLAGWKAALEALGDGETRA